MLNTQIRIWQSGWFLKILVAPQIFAGIRGLLLQRPRNKNNGVYAAPSLRRTASIAMFCLTFNL